jgi:enoyl-CoA hydratase
MQVTLPSKVIATVRQARGGRVPALRQWDLSEEEAISNEMRGGLEVIASGETFSGAARFASGVGRHGAFGREVND